jgi:sortase A
MRLLRRFVALLVALVVAGCSSGTVELAEPERQVPRTTSTTATTEPEAAPVPPPAEEPAPEVAAPAAEEDPILVGTARPTPARSASRRGAKPEPTGHIEIPAIGLSHATYEGIDLATINHGPSHWPGTAMPGERGNTVFPGHRTTYSRPFWDIDKLVAGDEVIFTTPAGRFTYRVTETFVVGSRETWIVDQTEHATFTIFACHPKGSARQRYVAKGELVPPPATTTTTAPPAEERSSGIVPLLPG